MMKLLNSIFLKAGLVTNLVLCTLNLFSSTVIADEVSDNEKVSFGDISREGLPPGWDYQSNTENPHAVIVVLGANPRINDIPLQPGDYIGAFYMDDFGELKCGGADVWNGSENIIFAVFGNDPGTPEKDGFSYNEIMHFKFYYQGNNKDYNVTTVSWDPEYGSTNKWNPLGLSSSIDMQCEIEFDAYATYDVNPLCVGQTVNLQGHIFIETTGNYTWQWSSIPAGLNANEQSVSHAPGETTTYILEVSDGINISIHEIVINVNMNPTVDAGEDNTICIDQSAMVEALAENSSGIFWTTAGDGTFNDPASAEATYFPGENDRQLMEVELSVSAFPFEPCQAEATDSKVIHITNYPEITIVGSQSFCENQDIIVEAVATSYEDVLWMTSGDGTFSTPDTLTTQYFPGPSDLISNEFELNVNVSAVAPCEGTVSDQVLITLQDGATINAPTSKTACSDSPVNLNSLAFNYTTSLWTTEGDGTFLDSSMLNTVYYPGTEDVLNGGTVVTIQAFGAGLCEDYSTAKNILINLAPLPEVDAGPDTEACNGSLAQLQGMANNTTYVAWSTLGDGYFDNPYVTNPNYYPGILDISAGSVRLFMTAFAIYPCTNPTTDSVDVAIMPDATVEIGTNTGQVCYDEGYTFTETEASNYSGIEWFTVNGDGVFDDPGLLNPTYIPDPEHDYLLGSVIIGVMVMPIEPCTLVSDDFFTLQFQPYPTIDAGENDTIIQGDTFVPAPTIDNYSAVLWETSGDGTFSDASAPTPEYFPGIGDVESYNATLKITAFPNEACNVVATDSVSVFIFKSQTIQVAEGNNGFSSYIDYEDKTFVEIMEPYDENLVFAQKFSQVYWPEYGINTMDGFSNTTGVKLVMNSGASLQLTGFEVDDKTITLKEGWNLLPVLNPCPIAPQQLYELLTGTLIIITQVDGDKYFKPGVPGNTLEQLVPGKCYMVKVTSGTTFLFPGCD